MYIFEVHQEEIGPAPGEYCGPAIENDGEQWRNETAYINCVFGSDRRPNVRAQASRQRLVRHLPSVLCSRSSTTLLAHEY